MEKIARKFTIEGLVQGVGYRFFSQRIAIELGISGYTKNLYDGKVEVLAIGLPEQIELFKNYLAKGPSRAIVSKVIEENTDSFEIFDNFYIK
jgi:acylphosphatase